MTQNLALDQAVRAEPSVVGHRDIAYRQTPERPLHCDVYGPPIPARDEEPVVVLFHGGAWEEGDTGQLSRYALDLVSAGYVAVEVQYRLSGDARYPAQREDARAALRWVVDNADGLGVDSDRLAVFGHSAGAHLAALAGTYPDGVAPSTAPDVAAVVAASGVYDFTTPPEEGHPDEAAAEDLAPIFSLFGGRPDEVPERYADASPVHHVHEESPPHLLLHGTADDVVPVTSTEEYASALRGVDVDVETFLAEGGDHVFLHGSAWYDEAFDRVVSFLDERV